MILTPHNIQRISREKNPLVYRYVFTGDKWKNHEIVESVTYQIPGGVRTIPAGFRCDLSSVPRILWWWMPPFGRPALAYVFHDELYVNKLTHTLSRKQCDRLMYDYAKALNGTERLMSLRNFDNWLRYVFVRAFGWYLWNKRKRTKQWKLENCDHNWRFGLPMRRTQAERRCSKCKTKFSDYMWGRID